jgi:hypothetical protein
MASIRTFRQRAGQALNEIYVGAVDAVTPTTITDADLIDPVETDTKYAAAWMLIATGAQAGTERRILRYAPSSGTVTLSRPLGTLPAVKDEFEIHTLIQPSVFTGLVEQALYPLYFTDVYDLVIVADRRIYTLPFCESPGQVVSVENRAQGDLAETPFYPVVWKPIWIEGTTAVEIEPGSLTDPSGTLHIRFLKKEGSPSGDEVSYASEIEYGVCAILCKVYEYLMRAGPAQDVSRYERLLVYEQTRLNVMHRKYSPRGRVMRVIPPQLIGWSGS